MATGPLLALLFAAVPQAWAGIADFLGAGLLEGAGDTAAVASIDVNEPVARGATAPAATKARSKALAATTSAALRPARPARPGLAVVLIDAPAAAPTDVERPRRPVWRSPSPPQGPPA